MSALKVPPGARGRILRIGVLLGGKIIEEKLIRERISVSVGQSMKNTFSVPVEGLPLEFTLFAMDPSTHKYSLRFLPRMDGRVTDSSGNVQTLDQLRSKGAQNLGAYSEVPLPDSSRGKLSIGDLTILFQFVTEPPRQPRPMLPASVRGTFADRFDPRLSVIMGSSIIAHFAIVIFALLMDVDTGDSTADRAYNLTFKPETYTADLTPPPEDKKQATDAGSAAEKPKEPEKKAPERVVPTKAPDKDAGRKAAEQVAMKEEQAKALAALLVAEGPDGKQEGDMSKRRPGADLGQQIADVREGNKQVAIGNNTGRGSRGTGDPRTGTGHGPGVDTGNTGDIGTGKTVENTPTGRISVSSKQAAEDTTLTADAVLNKINSAYMPGIKRCYKEYLKKDASARGKVALDFTVNQTGRVVSGKAAGVADEVDSCIGNLMNGWTFPKPKDKGGEATDAPFIITLQLVPE